VFTKDTITDALINPKLTALKGIVEYIARPKGSTETTIKFLAKFPASPVITITQIQTAIGTKTPMGTDYGPYTVTAGASGATPTGVKTITGTRTGIVTGTRTGIVTGTRTGIVTGTRTGDRKSVV
jgi:hypothetical protein